MTYYREKKLGNTVITGIVSPTGVAQPGIILRAGLSASGRVLADGHVPFLVDVIRGNVNLPVAALRSSALVLRILPALGLDGLTAEGTFVRLAVVLQDLQGQRVPHVLDPGLDGDDVDVVVLCDIIQEHLVSIEVFWLPKEPGGVHVETPGRLVTIHPLLVLLVYHGLDPHPGVGALRARLDGAVLLGGVVQ